jgi:ubiquinone/menaquinone biosynthesis C-methylase UbiE
MNHLETSRYERWASYYEAFEKPGSSQTWRLGIVAELKSLGLHPDEVLDLGAGTGTGFEQLRTLFPAARIRGLDVSAAMLNASCMPPELRILADMATFELPSESVDCIVSGYDALNTLDKYALARCLDRVGRTLRPGGYFVFDYSSSELIRHVWADLQFERQREDLTLKFSHRYDPVLDRSCVTLEMRCRGALQWTEEHHHYSYDPVVMNQLMRIGNLQIQHIRNLEQPFYSPSSEAHVYVARRV